MMTGFARRRETFESKFAHDEALRFKAIARRNKLLGLWAAARLGKTGAEAEAYASAVVSVDFDEPGDGDVIRKVVGDLRAAGVPGDADEVRRVLHELLVVATGEVNAGM
jgi:hypothetical protein